MTQSPQHTTTIHITTPSSDQPLPLDISKSYPTGSPLSFDKEDSFSFLLPSSQYEFDKNIGIACTGYPEMTLADLEQDKSSFWAEGAYLVRINKIDKSSLSEEQQKEKIWVKEGDLVFIQLRGPFRRSVAFWDQENIGKRVAAGDRPQKVEFQPSQEDFALLNDLHVMTMHRTGGLQ